MYFDEGTVFRLIMYAIALILAIWLFKKGRGIWAKTKEILFTPEALLATLLHVFLAVGLFGVWTASEVYVFDHDVQIGGKVAASKK